MILSTAEEANHTLKKVLVEKGDGIALIDREACCVPTKLYCRIRAEIVEKKLLNSAT